MKSSLTATRNYLMFDRSRENRPVDIKRHKGLRKSMEKFGWVAAYPLHATRMENGRLVIIDGQHRFEIAKELGIPVWYVVTNNQVDVATINNAQKPWVNADYAGTFAQRGNKDYERLLEFSAEHRITIPVAASLLAGTISFNNIQQRFRDGTWKITDERFASMVCMIASAFDKYGMRRYNKCFIDAVAACCRVRGFDPRRLVSNLSRCPDKVMPYSTRTAMLRMLEEIYNFGRVAKHREPLALDAEKAMSERNPSAPKKTA